MKMYPRTFSGLPAVQLQSELTKFMGLIASRNVCSYLEVGAGRGDTMHEIGIRLPAGSKIMAIDHAMQSWGLQNSAGQLLRAVNDLRRYGHKVESFQGNSRDEQCVFRARISGPFDLVFIDGDHTYEGVKADWENYGYLGKMVAFHDIADPSKPNNLGEIIQVNRFWNEIKKRYRNIEFIDETAKYPMGIGVIFLD